MLVFSIVTIVILCYFPIKEGNTFLNLNVLRHFVHCGSRTSRSGSWVASMQQQKRRLYRRTANGSDVWFLASPKMEHFGDPNLGKGMINHCWLVVWNMTFMTFHILGMSSSQLTFIFFQRGRYTTNQSLDLEVRLKIWNANSSTILMFFVIFRKRHGYKLEVQARSRLASTWG